MKVNAKGEGLSNYVDRMTAELKLQQWTIPKKQIAIGDLVFVEGTWLNYKGPDTAGMFKGETLANVQGSIRKIPAQVPKKEWVTVGPYFRIRNFWMECFNEEIKAEFEEQGQHLEAPGNDDKPRAQQIKTVHCKCNVACPDQSTIQFLFKERKIVAFNKAGAMHFIPDNESIDQMINALQRMKK